MDARSLFFELGRGRERVSLAELGEELGLLRISDVDAVEAEFGRPAGVPPYGCEFKLRDPDGNRLRISRLAS